jgi:hypothetical protein
MIARRLKNPVATSIYLRKCCQKPEIPSIGLLLFRHFGAAVQLALLFFGSLPRTALARQPALVR